MKVTPQQAVRMKPEVGAFVNGQAFIDIQEFGGLNTRKTAKVNESPDMLNMSADAFPLATTRRPRSLAYTGSGTPRALLASVKLCGVIGTSFIWDILGTPTAKITGLSAGDKSLVDFNGCVLIFPDKKFYNYVTDTNGTITCTFDIDMACVWMNRIWGVKGDTIYASAWGNKDSWDTVQDNELSGYQVTTGTQGDFCSIRTYGSHPVLKKPGSFTFEIYGSKNSNWRYIEVVSDGSINNKTDVELLGSQYYLGPNGVMRYGGGYPEPLSLQLSDTFTDGAMGSDGRRLYASLYNGTAWSLLVYDPIFDLWMREDALQVISFARFGGYLYALAADAKVWKLRSGTETISWYRDTIMTDDGTLHPKENIEIWLQLDAESGTTITLSLRSGSRDDFEQVGQVTLTSAGRQVLRFPLTSADARLSQVRVAGDKATDLYWLQRVAGVKEG